MNGDKSVPIYVLNMCQCCHDKKKDVAIKALIPRGKTGKYLLYTEHCLSCGRNTSIKESVHFLNDIWNIAAEFDEFLESRESDYLLRYTGIKFGYRAP